MLDTKAVRKIMQAHGFGPIWTNKRKGDIRTVKCYYYGGELSNNLVKELKEKAGEDNVRVTQTPKAVGEEILIPGIVVTCVIRK